MQTRSKSNIPHYPIFAFGQKLIIYKCKDFLALVVPRILKFLKDNFSLNMTPKQKNNSLITKLHKLFECSRSVSVQYDALSVQVRMLMRTSVNNDLSNILTVVLILVRMPKLACLRSKVNLA